ncbi:MAG TPA: Ig-like domain-containing protein [Burkholderiaceae bacterium]|nr:Ig-like domain-containing protein [Burkholderiaceae bacterium]
MNTPANANVSGNDKYPPNSTFTPVTPPSHGTVTLYPDGSYTYTPANNYSGTDTFTYKVCELAPNDTLCSTATVTVTVAAGVSDMMATGAATQTVPVNTTITVVTTCTNNGPQVAINATCSVAGIPTTATFAAAPGAGVALPSAAAAAAGPGSGTTCVPVTPVANLALGGVITCTTMFTPTQAGTVTLQTTVASDTPDSNPANDVAPSVVIVTDNAPPRTLAAPVPAMSQWTLLLLGLLLAAAGAARSAAHRR